MQVYVCEDVRGVRCLVSEISIAVAHFQTSLFGRFCFVCTVQTFKICETGIFAKDTPQNFFCEFFLFCDQKFEWRARNKNFWAIVFFNLRSQTKPMHPMQISMHTNDTL